MKRTSFVHLVLALAALVLAAKPASAAGPCPPDTNCSGGVDVNDLLSVITSWGTTSPSADVNGSGLVDVNDLLLVIQAWGPCVFDFGPVYPNAEAHQVGLEMLGTVGPLTLGQAQYDRVERDMALIRKAYPALASQTHTLAWAPNQFIAALIQGQSTAVFDCLNAYYQMVEIDPLFSSGGQDWVVVILAGKFNVPRMCDIYAALPEVNFAEPNGLVGGQNFWKPSIMINGSWRWEIDDGFHDCFDGCDCHRLYTLEVDAAGSVTEIDYQEIGQSWCEW